MALHTELPIYRTGVRLLSLAVKVQEQMPRSIKRILGDKITQHCVDLLDLMALANASQHEARAEYIGELLKRQRAVTVLLPDPLIQHRGTFATIIGYSTDQMHSHAAAVSAADNAALRAELERLTRELAEEMEHTALLRTERDALREDAERYRWLSARAIQKTSHDVYGKGGFWSIGVHSEDHCKNLFEVIDAAIQKELT